MIKNKYTKTLLLFLMPVIFLASCNEGNILTGKLSTSDLQEQVLVSIKETLAEDPDYDSLRITGFTLVHKSGNHYSGVLEAEIDGEDYSSSVDVIYDGESFMWEMLE